MGSAVGVGSIVSVTAGVGSGFGSGLGFVVVAASSVKPARASWTRPEVVFSKNEERSSMSRVASQAASPKRSTAVSSLDRIGWPSLEPRSDINASRVLTHVETCRSRSSTLYFSRRTAVTCQ